MSVKQGLHLSSKRCIRQAQCCTAGPSSLLGHGASLPRHARYTSPNNLYRTFHDTAPQRLLWFDAPTQPPPRDVLRQIRAVKVGQGAQLLKLYPELVRMKQIDTAITLSRSDIRKLMKHLGHAKEPGPQLHLLEDIFHHLEPTWGIEPSTPEHALVVGGYINAGRYEAALRWVQHSSNAGISAQSVFAEVLANMISQGRHQDALALSQQLRDSGVALSERGYGLLLREALIAGDTESIATLRSQMEYDNISAGPSVLGALLHSSNQAERRGAIEKLRALAVERQVMDVQTQSLLIRQVGLSEGWGPAASLAIAFRTIHDSACDPAVAVALSEVVPDPQNFTEATESLTLLSELTHLDVAVDAPATISVLVRKVLKEQGQQTQEMVALANRWVDAQGKDAGREAKGEILECAVRNNHMGIIRDLWRDMESTKEVSPSDLSQRRSILQASIAVSDVDLTKAVLINMKGRSLKFDRDDLVPIVVSMIKADWPRKAVWDVYVSLMAADPKGPTRTFFDITLNAYLDRYLNPNKYHQTSTGRYEDRKGFPMGPMMRILSDMKEAGCPADASTYRTLLHHYADVARLTVNPLGSLPQVERLHTLIRIDRTFDPDAPLLSALLKAYSYHGQWKRAWSTWDQLCQRMSSTLGLPAVINVLDMAGYEAQAFNVQDLDPRAHQIWHRLKKNGFQSVSFENKNLWDTWVETLARVGKLDEAESIVFQEMAVNKGKAPSPDETTLRLLLRLTRCQAETELKANGTSSLWGQTKQVNVLESDNRFTLLRQKIRTRLPDVWLKVQAEGLTEREVAAVGL